MKVTKKGNKAWVTFDFKPEDTVEGVTLVGEWNDWTPETMKVKKDGSFYITKVLPTGQSYQFGYRTDGDRWCTDGELPCVPSPFGSENALLEL
jgi:1,4-alpha-glucan branching enzyme